MKPYVTKGLLRCKNAQGIRIEIAVEYQAEKVALMAKKTTFLKFQAKFESFF